MAGPPAGAGGGRPGLLERRQEGMADEGIEGLAGADWRAASQMSGGTSAMPFSTRAVSVALVVLPHRGRNPSKVIWSQ